MAAPAPLARAVAAQLRATPVGVRALLVLAGVARLPIRVAVVAARWGRRGALLAEVAVARSGRRGTLQAEAAVARWGRRGALQAEAVARWGRRGALQAEAVARWGHRGALQAAVVAAVRLRTWVVLAEAVAARRLALLLRAVAEVGPPCRAASSVA